ncbi:hypothetical protein MMC30_000453 [Trapelia coarctata]|nr:hypothetical protein [Trapelia coarctata]
MSTQDTSSTSFLESTSFDIIIVGGGISGLVVASRLSEDPHIHVLVIEAGANRLNDPRITVPGLAPSMYFDPDFDWCHMSTHQSGFDAWGKFGNPGWSWEAISPYFRKFHTLTFPSSNICEQLDLGYLAKELNGTSGPVQASFGEDSYNAFNLAWSQTFKNLNHDLTGDPISGVATGAFTNPGAIDPKTRTRSHAGNTYYNPQVSKRPNLHVLTEALVEKVLLQQTPDGSVIAIGVRVSIKAGEKHDVLAKDEVILAAGTIKTPQLLELSGIGGADLLKQHGIDVVVDNASVGENLQEHGYVPFSWEIADDHQSGDILRQPEVMAAVMEAHQKFQAGPLGVCATGSSYMPLVDISEDELNKLPDTHLTEHTYNDFPSKKRQYELLRQILQSPHDGSGQYTLAPFQLNPRHGPSPKGIYGMGTEGNYISIVSVLNHSFSRGSVHIKSANPTLQPVFDPRMLSHPLDLELLSRHVQWLETLAATEPMVSLLKKNGRRIHSDKAVRDLETAKEVTRETTICHYHVVGTCAMMPREMGGVVNERLVVYGTQNLRIVDASIFPLIPRGNTQSSVYAITERAADIIREDRGSRKKIAV